MTIHIPALAWLALTCAYGAVTAWLLGVLVSYALLFRRAAWRCDRRYLSLRWPVTLPLTAWYYIRWRRLEARARRNGSRHRSPVRVVIAIAMAEQSRIDR